MSYLILPKRALRGRLLKFQNFGNGEFVNLIEMDKPYANGISFTVYEYSKNPFCSNGLFKTKEEALKKFDLMVKNQLIYLNKK